MGLFKRIVGILGLGKDEHQEARDHKEADDLDADDGIRNVNGDRVSFEPIPGAPRKGFAVPVQVAGQRPNLGPLIVPCDGDGDGGVQLLLALDESQVMSNGSSTKVACGMDVNYGFKGLKWYAKRFRVDEDGDVGDEFLDQVSSDAACRIEGEPKPSPKFQVKYIARPAKVYCLQVERHVAPGPSNYNPYKRKDNQKEKRILSIELQQDDKKQTKSGKPS